MVCFAWFVFGFTVVQIIVASVNLFFRAKLRKGTTGENPLVSVLIPARNEEKNIVNILNDLIAQDYENIEVIVFNDHSCDRTAEIIEQYVIKDTRIKLVNSENLPAGWLGKNWACHSLSRRASGEYFLFLDADVRISGGLITNVISYANHHELVLVSIFPKQIQKSVGEKITVPNMNYILLSLLPLVLVRKSGIPSLAAANGQFMFFRAFNYKLLLPHSEMRKDMVEDIGIARYYKIKKQPIACLTGDNTIKCRMYEGFTDAVNGFSKNVGSFFGNSLILALLFWIVTTFGFLFILFELPFSLFLVYIIGYIVVRINVSIVSEQNAAYNLILMGLQQFSMGLFIFKAIINNNFKTYRWKGRDINW